MRCLEVHGFYGEPVTHMRHESWELLSLNRRFNLPWLMAGDFNEIVRNSEKKGGNNRSLAQMQRFREALHAYGFMDLRCGILIADCFICV